MVVCRMEYVGRMYFFVFGLVIELIQQPDDFIASLKSVRTEKWSW